MKLNPGLIISGYEYNKIKQSTKSWANIIG